MFEAHNYSLLLGQYRARSLSSMWLMAYQWQSCKPQLSKLWGFSGCYGILTLKIATWLKYLQKVFQQTYKGQSGYWLVGIRLEFAPLKPDVLRPELCQYDTNSTVVSCGWVQHGPWVQHNWSYVVRVLAAHSPMISPFFFFIGVDR